MPSYVVTGASRGIGFEFVRQLSGNPAATVVALVRNIEVAEKKYASELPRQNIHIIYADLTDHKSLKKAAEETAKITGGPLDYVIANASYMPDYFEFQPIGEVAEDPEKWAQELDQHFRITVMGNIQLLCAFLPLIQKGQAKKVIALSSGLADPDLISKFDIDGDVAYSISKASLNMAIAKFSAQYRKDGVLFMSIAPGLVATRDYSNVPKEMEQPLQALMQKFWAYAPHFAGQASPEESVSNMLEVIEKASVENGDGGTFVSHFGNKQWL
ncbi:NAD(P)-binding protein [Thozetella sp. PMI_491]|nr:NAD(P)-binding protein [Thozetella sp. PMI_491]